MAQQKQVAALYIFLVLSMHPVQAFRSRQNVETFSKFADSQDLMAELQKALNEDTQGQEMQEEYPGEWFGHVSCDQRKADFERRVGKTEKRYDVAMEDEKMDIVEAAWVTLKVRTAAKTLSKAQRDKCAWVEDETVDKSGLERLVAKTAGKSTCFEAAKARLHGAATGSEEEQGRAMKEAMSIFLSDNCEAQEMPANVNSDMDERTEEIEADDGAELLKDAALQAEKKRGSFLETLGGDELLQAEGISPSEVSALVAKGSTTAADSVLLETAESLLAGNGFGEIFGRILGWIFLAILWALFCWVLMAIMMFILGLIMCVVKIIIVAILRLFGSSKWNFDYLGCVGWWLKALGHGGGHSGNIGIALCAADMMHR